jgi:RNA polymerase sigma factor (sigma-70 family)
MVSPPSPDDVALLSEVIRRVSRARRLSSPDAEDFAQSVQLRCLESNYYQIRKYAGRSSLRTYLTVVVVRMLSDWRTASHGKWRASTAALRAGEHAVTLERLMSRDGFACDEAVAIVAAGAGAPTASELTKIAARLRVRPPRRIVSDGILEHLRSEDFDDPVEASERQGVRRRVRTNLVTVLRDLPATERRVLYLKFREQRTLKEIAAMISVDERALYRRFERCLRLMRQRLVAAGVKSASV